MTDIVKLSTGAAVRFDRTPVKGRRPTVVMVHGWKSDVFTSKSYEEPRELLLKNGCNVLSVSLRGHAQATGNMAFVTRQQHLNDLRAALRFLETCPGVNPKRISALGVSYGGYLLSVLANEVPFRALALRAPALHPEAHWRMPTAELSALPTKLAYRSAFHTPADNRAMRGAATVPSLTLVASELDEDMPAMLTMSYLLAATHADREAYLEIIPGAKHTLMTSKERQQYLKVLEDQFLPNL